MNTVLDYVKNYMKETSEKDDQDTARQRELKNFERLTINDRDDRDDRDDKEELQLTTIGETV